MFVAHSLLAMPSSASSEEQLRRLEQVIVEAVAARANGEEIAEVTYDALCHFLEVTTIIKLVVVEKMLRLGVALKPAMKRLVSRVSDPEIRTLAALSLWWLGDRSEIAVLLDTLRRGDDYFALTARVLADSGVVEAAPLIFQFISTRATMEQYDVLAQSIAALRKLHVEIPDALRNRWLADPKCHPYVRLELGEGKGEWSR